MPRGKRKQEEEVANQMPMNVADLEPIVKEFIEKMNTIKQEEETLKEDRKALIEEYKEKLDVKTLNQAMKVCDLKAKVDRKETFDLFVRVLSGEVGED
mgnify:CR=1 FL=1